MQHRVVYVALALTLCALVLTVPRMLSHARHGQADHPNTETLETQSTQQDIPPLW
jgi:hypothetical protein